jgi:aarF domain-containing kinase
LSLISPATGSFNGDPHPGNIMLLKDGRLGLIDYGQVKHMTVAQRIVYAKLILAHARNDAAEVVRIHFEEQGVRTQKSDPKIAYLYSAFYNDRDSEDVCGGLNIASFIDYLEREDPMVRLPEAYIMAGRVSVMMRGMGKAFGLSLRTSKLWEEDAAAFLKSQGVDY